jgi:serine/threonine protein kinase
VAVKTFEARVDAADEVKNLQQLKSSLTRNDNIALHLGLIDHCSQYLIIFPRAQLGDLWQFIYCGSPPADSDGQKHNYIFDDRFPRLKNQDADLAHSLLEQSLNLAHALNFLHTPTRIGETNTFCAHMDLKPDNILLFDGGPVGMWKLCDFGISAFKASEDEEDTATSVGDLYYSLTTMKMVPKRGGGTYQAPEVFEIQHNARSRNSDEDRRRVGRKGDIWSFGAIFAELLAFSLRRDEYVTQFRKSRLDGCKNPPNTPRDDFFFDHGSAAASQVQGRLMPELPQVEFRVRPGVGYWLRKIAKEASSPRRFIDCWAEVVLQILEVDIGQRPDSARLVQMVDHVLRHMTRARHSKDVPCEFLDTQEDKNRALVTSSSRSRRQRATAPASLSAPKAPTQTMLKPVSRSRQPITRLPPTQLPGALPPDPSPPLFTNPLAGSHSSTTPSHPAAKPLDPLTSPPPAMVVTQPSFPVLPEAQLDPRKERISRARTPEFTSPPESLASRDSGSTNGQVLGASSQSSTSDFEKRDRQLSESSKSSPSLILGQPSGAYGITCRQNRRRDRADPSRVAKFQPKPKGIKYVSVDSNTYGCIRVAYLCDKTVHIYHIDLESQEKEIKTCLDRSIPLSGKKNKWIGVALAWPYMLAWGERADGTAVVSAKSNLLLLQDRPTNKQAP